VENCWPRSPLHIAAQGSAERIFLSSTGYPARQPASRRQFGFVENASQAVRACVAIAPISVQVPAGGGGKPLPSVVYAHLVRRIGATLPPRALASRIVVV
jgi:hypothetical protein